MTNRELDALVAEKVMGWTVSNGSAFSPNGSRRAADIYWRDGSPRWVDHYATDMNMTWDVVEKMGDAFGGVYPSYDVNPVRLVHWCAIVNGRERIGVIADTAPRAICLAALKSVGVEVSA